jgi:uncharacterized membrane protein YkvA (DUF1232 family)
MSQIADDTLFVLQRFVNSYSQDLLEAHAAVWDLSTPQEAQRYLIGGLNYALNKLDIFPDHRGPAGVTDDAIVLRLAAKLARGAGAKHPALEPLALDANNVINLLGDLAMPLEQYVKQLAKVEVRGRTADKLLANNALRAQFDADILNEAKNFKPERIATKSNAVRVVDELYRSIKDTLIRAKLHR